MTLITMAMRTANLSCLLPRPDEELRIPATSAAPVAPASNEVLDDAPRRWARPLARGSWLDLWMSVIALLSLLIAGWFIVQGLGGLPSPPIQTTGV